MSVFIQDLEQQDVQNVAVLVRAKQRDSTFGSSTAYRTVRRCYTASNLSNLWTCRDDTMSATLIYNLVPFVNQRVLYCC